MLALLPINDEVNSMIIERRMTREHLILALQASAKLVLFKILLLLPVIQHHYYYSLYAVSILRIIGLNYFILISLL